MKKTINLLAKSLLVIISLPVWFFPVIWKTGKLIEDNIMSIIKSE